MGLHIRRLPGLGGPRYKKKILIVSSIGSCYSHSLQTRVYTNSMRKYYCVLTGAGEGGTVGGTGWWDWGLD